MPLQFLVLDFGCRAKEERKEQMVDSRGGVSANPKVWTNKRVENWLLKNH